MKKGVDFLKEVLEKQALFIQIEVKSKPTNGMDGLIILNKTPLYILSKNQVFPIDVREIEEQINNLRGENYCMIVANYISPKANELLIEKKIQTLDQVGNIHLSIPNLTVKIQGVKNKTTPEIHKNRAFTKTGASVIFQFLMEPDVVNNSQREIAIKAGVSLGTIPKVFSELIKEGYVIRLNQKEYKLVQYQKLLNKWAEVVKEKVLPANFIQWVTPFQKTPNELIKERKIREDTQWGGEAAATLLTNYLNPENYTIFTSLTPNELLKTYKLIPTQEHHIAVYKKFWNYPSIATSAFVHPLLVYAQLITSGDSRNLEIAQIIYDEYIQNKL